MFEYIFRCYKNDICQSFVDKLKKMACIDRIIFVTLIIITIVGASLVIILQNVWGVAILLLFFISTPMITAYRNKRLQKNRHTELNEYMLKRITPLIKLLTGESYALYNKKSIGWLIERCDEMAEDKKDKSLFFSVFQPLLPVITLLLGAFLAKMNLQEMMVVAIVIITILLYLYICANVEDIFLGEDKRLAGELKADLQYISTLLPE